MGAQNTRSAWEHFAQCAPAVGAKMWCLFFLLLAGLPRSDKLPVLNLLTLIRFFGPQVFRPTGATRCTDSRQTWQGRRAPGSSWLRKISPQSPQAVGMRPKNIKKNPLFGRGDSLDRFRKLLGAFIRLTILL